MLTMSPQIEGTCDLQTTASWTIVVGAWRESFPARVNFCCDAGSFWSSWRIWSKKQVEVVGCNAGRLASDAGN